MSTTKFTNATGAPVADNTNIMTAGLVPLVIIEIDDLRVNFVERRLFFLGER
jgi:hypothetical protein